MSERYKKIIVRWKSPKGLSIGFLLTLVSVLIGALFVEYLSIRGLEDKVDSVQVGAASFPVHILYLPLMGIPLLFVFEWVYLVQETAYVRAIPGLTSEGELLSIRMVKYAALVVAMFTSSLFIPYLLGSTLFLGFVGRVMDSARFVEPYVVQAITMMSSLHVLNENSKYPLSLDLASLISVVLTLIIARRGRKTVLARRR